MKISRKDFEAFKKDYKDAVGVSLDIDGAESYFDDTEGEEYVLLPKLSPHGVALILDYLEEKHKQQSNIMIVNCEFGNNENFKNALESFNQMENGAKMCLLIYEGNHWRTMLCERRNDKSHIAFIDSCGITMVVNPLEELVASTPTLKENCVLYRSVNKMQVAENNCGIFSIRAAQKLMKEKDFFGKLEKGNLILTKAEANSHFVRSKQQVSGSECNIQTDHFFALPPEYFSLAQKKSYLKHYKNEFGERPGVAEFTHQNTTGEIVHIDDLFNKQKREDVLSDAERRINYFGQVTPKEDHNVNVVYFSNKYIESALLNQGRLNAQAHPDMSVKKRRALLLEKAKGRLVESPEGQKRIAAIAKGAKKESPALESNVSTSPTIVREVVQEVSVEAPPVDTQTVASTIDDNLSKHDVLESATLTVSADEKRQLDAQAQEHYQVLVAEDTLYQSLAPVQARPPALVSQHRVAEPIALVQQPPQISQMDTTRAAKNEAIQQILKASISDLDTLKTQLMSKNNTVKSAYKEAKKGVHSLFGKDSYGKQDLITQLRSELNNITNMGANADPVLYIEKIKESLSKFQNLEEKRSTLNDRDNKFVDLLKEIDVKVCAIESTHKKEQRNK